MIDLIMNFEYLLHERLYEHLYKPIDKFTFLHMSYFINGLLSNI